MPNRKSNTLRDLGINWAKVRVTNSTTTLNLRQMYACFWSSFFTICPTFSILGSKTHNKITIESKSTMS